MSTQHVHQQAPMLEEFREGLRKTLFKFLDAPIDALIESYGPAYVRDTNHHLAVLRRAFPDKEWPGWYVNSFVRWNWEILKEERYFEREGHYSGENAAFSSIQSKVYDNPDVMEGYYLAGLYLSYFLWPHHYELRNFFQASFIDPHQGEGTLMEWGVGHGLFTLLALSRWPKARAKAYDISSYSIDFARRLLSGQGFENVEFLQEDVLVADMPPADYIICGELLEHLPEPEKLIHQAFKTLRAGGKMFLTGAINAPQQDHLHCFHTQEEILDLVTRHSFTILSSRKVTHPNRAGDPSPPQVLALILKKS